jgi:hypothetical protein
MEMTTSASDKEQCGLPTIALTCIQELPGSYLCEDTEYPDEGSAVFRSQFLQDVSWDNTLQENVIVSSHLLPSSPFMITQKVAVEQTRPANLSSDLRVFLSSSSELRAVGVH